MLTNRKWRIVVDGLVLSIIIRNKKNNNYIHTYEFANTNYTEGIEKQYFSLVLNLKIFKILKIIFFLN